MTLTLTVITHGGCITLQIIWTHNLNYLDYLDYPQNLNYLEKNLEKKIPGPNCVTKVSAAARIVPNGTWSARHVVWPVAQIQPTAHKRLESDLLRSSTRAGERMLPLEPGDSST